MGGRWVSRRTSKGNTFQVWEWPVPRVPKEWLDAIVYLYPGKTEAGEGAPVGATGFIVSVPPEDRLISAQLGHHYVVTNDHVLKEGDGIGAVRANLKAGGVDVLEVEESDWISHPFGDDLAVAPLRFAREFRYSAVNREMILSPDQQESWTFGPGDDVFFIGRYVDFDGTTTNTPTVRSGIISAYPAEPVYQEEREHDQDTILVEARSLSGYSGSPVFVTRAQRIERVPEHEDLPRVPMVRLDTGGPCFLLGVDYGHYPWREDVRDAKTRKKVPYYVESNSGLMMVVPAEKLLTLLDHPKLIEKRREVEQEEVEKLMDKPKVVLDTANEPAEFDRFEDLTDKLLRVPKKELDEKRKEEKC
jgi:Trypsin-like peptidase domain